MKLINQVATFEQSRMLNDMGVIGNTFFIWTTKFIQTGEEGVQINIRNGNMSGWEADVFTVAELGLMLPDEHKSDPFYTYWVDERFGEPGRHFTTSILNADMQVGWKTEAQARAEMLIYLIHKGITSAAEVNNRLIKSHE